MGARRSAVVCASAQVRGGSSSKRVQLVGVMVAAVVGSVSGLGGRERGRDVGGQRARAARARAAAASIHMTMTMAMAMTPN